MDVLSLKHKNPLEVARKEPCEKDGQISFLLLGHRTLSFEGRKVTGFLVFLGDDDLYYYQYCLKRVQEKPGDEVDQRAKKTQRERETVEEKQNIKSRDQGAPGLEGLRRRRNRNEWRVRVSVELIHSVLRGCNSIYGGEGAWCNCERERENVRARVSLLQVHFSYTVKNPASQLSSCVQHK